MWPSVSDCLAACMSCMCDVSCTVPCMYDQIYTYSISYVVANTGEREGHVKWESVSFSPGYKGLPHGTGKEVVSSVIRWRARGAMAAYLQMVHHLRPLACKAFGPQKSRPFCLHAYGRALGCFCYPSKKAWEVSRMASADKMHRLVKSFPTSCVSQKVKPVINPYSKYSK